MLRFPSFKMRFSTLALVSLALAAIVPACASDTVLDAEDYDQSCQTADDCESVLVGDVCGCACDFAAISKSDMERFQADDEAARSACDLSLSCAPCMDAPPVACQSGVCGFAQ